MEQIESSKKFSLRIIAVLISVAIFFWAGWYVWKAVVLPNRLYYAAGGGDVETLKALLASGINPSTPSMFGGWTPLHAAAHTGQTEIMKVLISQGADLDAKSERGITPLWVAVRSWHEKEALLLIEAGANVNVTVKDAGDGVPGTTPLHFAVEKDEKIVESLLENGADPNAKDNNGQTPLHRAVIRRAPESIIKKLFAKGANINAVDKTGKTPLELIEPNMESTKLLFEDLTKEKLKELTKPDAGEGK